MLAHGKGRKTCHIILLPANKLGETKTILLKDKQAGIVKVGKLEFVALPMEKKDKIGVLSKKYYNVSKKRWTSTTKLTRFK